MMNERIPKPTSGHLDRSFFFEVSRGRIRISTLRCPEVGLEFQLQVSRGRIVFQLEVSRGRIRIARNSRSRCGCRGVLIFEHDVRVSKRDDGPLIIDDGDDRRLD